MVLTTTTTVRRRRRSEFKMITVCGTGTEPSSFHYENVAKWKLKLNTDDNGNNTVNEIQRRGNARDERNKEL